jgi:hypothetical protein
MNRLWMRAFVLALTAAAMLAAFFTLVRPWYLRWGATDAEARMTLPGDEIVPNAASQTTRAITIDAAAENVWPWVAQIGQDRGGRVWRSTARSSSRCISPWSAGR